MGCCARDVASIPIIAVEDSSGSVGTFADIMDMGGARMMSFGAENALDLAGVDIEGTGQKAGSLVFVA